MVFAAPILRCAWHCIPQNKLQNQTLRPRRFVGVTATFSAMPSAQRICDSMRPAEKHSSKK